VATRAGHKYGAVRTEYDGTLYASKAEAEYAFNLDLRSLAGAVLYWNQPEEPLVLLDAPKAADRITYTPDFFVVLADQSWEYVEVKGMETPDWRLRLKLYKANGPPGIPLRIVYGDGREVVVTSRRDAVLSPAAGGGDVE
jgi:hypothetical protein